MATRQITSVILTPDGSPSGGAVVRFDLLDDAYTVSPPQTVPNSTVLAVADDTGALTVTLVSGLDKAYRATLPDRQTFDFAVPDGGPVTLEQLRADYSISPVPPQTVEDVIEAIAGAMFVDVAGDTMTGGLVINESGGDNDTRMEGDTVSDLFFLDASDDMIYNERLSVPDSGFFVYDNADASKRAQFQLSGISPGADRTYTVPNANGTMALQGQREDVTIASGLVTVTGPWVSILRVDTEAAAATDNLDTINGGTLGQLLVVMSRDGGRDVTVIDNGPLALAGNVSFTLANTNDTLTLIGLGGAAWREVGRSSN